MSAKKPDNLFDKIVPEMNEVFLKSYAEPQSFPKPEEGKYVHIKKHGMKLPFSWERIATSPETKGRYVPTGNKTLQRIAWFWGLMKYKTYRRLEKSLDKSRHFRGVSGYDWEDAEYLEFQQKKKWQELHG